MPIVLGIKGSINPLSANTDQHKITVTGLLMKETW